jgi:hemin uptake protein HemP
MTARTPFHRPEPLTGTGPAPAPAASPVASAGPRRLRSEDLFTGHAVEIEIEHQRQVYRLRRTSLGKLILTK